MNDSRNDWRSELLTRGFSCEEDACYEVWHRGLIVYMKDDRCVERNPLAIAHAFYHKGFNFNNLFGAFAFVIHKRDASEFVFWADNSGSQRLFVNKSEGTFHASVLSFVANSSRQNKLDYEAAFQLLTLGKIVDDRTLVEGLSRTDPDAYYHLCDKGLRIFSKRLVPLSSVGCDVSLGELVDLYVDSSNAKGIGAVSTGGTDSRAVIAHLVKKGVKPYLTLSGRPESADAAIASKIASTLSLSLDIYNPDEKESGWLQRGFDFFDGLSDAVLGYRHLRRVQLAKNAATLEFGGVGGEFYKNVFRHPLLIWKEPRTIDDAYAELVEKKLSAPSWFGQLLVQAESCTKTSLKRYVGEHTSDECLAKGNAVGFLLLRGQFADVSTGAAPYITKIDPLMDRNLIAEASQQSSRSLLLFRWQRKQIANACPCLSDIPTDQGFSCGTGMIDYLADFAKSIARTIGLVFKKIERVATGRQKVSPWEPDYKDAFETPEFADAFEACVEAGLLDQKSRMHDLPLSKVGSIVTIGMMLQYLFVGCKAFGAGQRVAEDL